MVFYPHAHHHSDKDDTYWRHIRLPLGTRVCITIMANHPIGEVVGYEVFAHMDPCYRIKYRVLIPTGFASRPPVNRGFYGDSLRIAWQTPDPSPSYILARLTPWVPVGHKSQESRED